MRLAIRQGVGLAAHTFDPFVKPKPILVETDDDVVHVLGDLIASLVEDREQQFAERMNTGANGNALFDQEGAHQIDRRRAPGNQSRSDPTALDQPHYLKSISYRNSLKKVVLKLSH